MAEPGLHMLEDQLVDLRADPADDRAVAPRQPQCRAAMLEPGVFGLFDQGVHFGREYARVSWYSRVRDAMVCRNRVIAARTADSDRRR